MNEGDRLPSHLHGPVRGPSSWWEIDKTLPAGRHRRSLKGVSWEVTPFKSRLLSKDALKSDKRRSRHRRNRQTLPEVVTNSQQPKSRQKMQECKLCRKMDDRNYRLQCGHEFCLFCLEFQIKQKKPCCNACMNPICTKDNYAIWKATHCICCDNWMSGSYGTYCENCWFESDEFAAKVSRSTATDRDNRD